MNLKQKQRRKLINRQQRRAAMMGEKRKTKHQKVKINPNLKLFIHVPKNGGRTLQRSKEVRAKVIPNSAESIKTEHHKAMAKVMKQYGEHVGSGMQHARWRDIKPEISSNRPAFAIIRNPWSKVVSRYTFNERIVRRRKKSHNYHSMSFEEFLDERHEMITRPYFWHRAVRNWYQQKDHVVDEEGILRCDILRLEHFGSDVVKYLDLKKVPDIRNVSNGKIIDNKITDRKDYKEFYNDKTKQIIADWYKDDIEFFGFDFDTAATKNIWYEDSNTRKSN